MHVFGESVDLAAALLRTADSQAEMVWQVAGSAPFTAPHNETSTPMQKFKGVGQIPSGKWRARIKIGGRNEILGFYKNATDAALAFDRHVPVDHPS